jgi:hypothetical protein
MPPGPHLIFDKSALQCLSLDETNWLDNFFYTVITPLFFAETLADLEKELGKGRTPDQVVGSLAIRTPDMHATPCAHHRKIMGGVLYGEKVPLDGRIPRDEGKVVELDGKIGVFYSKSPVEEALERWHHGEFLDVERQIAKQWRRELSGIDHTAAYSYFQNWFLMGKPKNLAEVKTLTDAYIDGSPQDGAFKFGLDLLDVNPTRQAEILERWKAAGSPSIREFVPYFRHIFGVDLFFELAIASDHISQVRPAGKADNKVDIAYLYYLPFCHIFKSRGNLHKRVVPLFLREDQSFVDAGELKADLQKLDVHYSALPEELKASGFHNFAANPPEDMSFLVTRLWDKHLPSWRKIKENKKPPDKLKDMKIVEEINRIQEMAESGGPVNTAQRPSFEETQFMQIIRNPLRRKGKWLRYSKDL